MSLQLDFAALEDCLKTLNHLFIDIKRLEAEAGYETKRGGYGDVQVSRLDSGTAGSKLVAAKTIYLRARHKEPQRLAFRLARELKVWSRLRHPHVLPLLGYYLDKDYKIAVLISEYMIYGDLKDYIELEQPSWDTRLHLIRDLTDGLAYLHGQSPPIRHGDLKTGNILINAERQALLADFGLSKALEEGPTGLTTSEGLKGTLRYYSPELIRETDVGLSLPSDIWAWACLVLEVLADRLPYSEKKSEHSIILALMNNEPPDDAKSLPIPLPTVRDLLADCWTIRPDDRPSAEHCLRILAVESSSLRMVIGIADSSHQDDTAQSLELDGANPFNQPLQHQTLPQVSQQPPPRPSNAPLQFVEFFATEYNTWIANRSLPSSSPTIDGKQVALHKLFLMVGAFGGCRAANEKKVWPFIGAKIGFPYLGGPPPPYSTPEVAEQMSQIYQNLLADFEIYWHDAFRPRDPDTIFPLPPQLQYLHPEIERLAATHSILLLQHPHPTELRSQSSGLGKVQPVVTSTTGGNLLQPPSPPQAGGSPIHLPRGLNLSEEQISKAKGEVVAAFTRHMSQRTYQCVNPTQEQAVLVEQGIQEIQSLLKQVAGNLVLFMALAPKEEWELNNISKMMVLLDDQRKMLQNQPAKKRFILDPDSLNRFRSDLGLFLTRVTDLQKSTLTDQLRSLTAPPHGPETLTAKESVSLAQVMHYPEGPSPRFASISPSIISAETGPRNETLIRKRQLEAHVMSDEGFSNTLDSRKRTRTDTASTSNKVTSVFDILSMEPSEVPSNWGDIFEVILEHALAPPMKTMLNSAP